MIDDPRDGYSAEENEIRRKRLEQKLQEIAAKSAERSPNASIDELRAPIKVRDYLVLLDGGSERILLEDAEGRRGCIEYNNSLGGEYQGQTLAYRARDKTWSPIDAESLNRVHAWIGAAVLRNEYPLEHFLRFAHYVKFAK